MNPSDFVKASESFKNANPHIFPQADSKTHVQVKSERSRAKRGGMNETEREYSLLLEALKQKGEIAWWGFEAITLRLADGCRYTPDFVTVKPCGTWKEHHDLTFIEIKGGHIWDDSKVKFKVAREQFWWAEFVCWQKKKGQWKQLY